MTATESNDRQQITPPDEIQPDRIKMRSLADCPLQVLVTNRLQVANILDRILAELGQSEIWQTTFSISEEFLRHMFLIKQRGKISAAHVIIDHKASVKTLKLWNFISAAYDSAWLSDNHSKILLVKSKDGRKVSVVTSQNLTRGNRYESTVIMTDEAIFDQLLSSFNLLTTHSLSLDDILRR